MKHFYENVPQLGNVAVSRHAQAKAEEDGITQEAFDRVLLSPINPIFRRVRTLYGGSVTVSGW
jgi:hypothetical protein